METIFSKFVISLQKDSLDGFLVSNPSSIFYLTGLKGLVPTDREFFVVYKDEKLFIITPRMYKEDALKCKSNLVDIIVTEERTTLLQTALKGLSVCKKIGFE